MVKGVAGARQGVAKLVQTVRNARAARLLGGGCFAAGTLVMTLAGPVPIEQVHAGDSVLARDEVSGELGYREVAQTFETPDQPLVDVEYERGEGEPGHVTATPNHPFATRERGFVQAGDLLPGMEVQSATGAWLRVRGVHSEARRAPVYNFEVEDFHTYFVGGDALWVHNNPCSAGAAAVRGAVELGGFARGVTAAEVVAINRGIEGGALYAGRSVESVLATASNYQGFYRKAAAVIRGIAHDHIFVNGNKRTAQFVYDLLRSRNGISTGIVGEELQAVIGRVAKGVLTDIDDIAKALRGF